MYGKCGSLPEAWDCFARIALPNLYSWTILITAYAQNGHLDEALVFFSKMALEGIKANAITFVVAINACAMLGDPRRGKALHDFLVPCGFFDSSLVGNSLIHMYGKCRDLDAAKSAFNELKKKDVVTWNSIISAYAQNGRGKEALELYNDMDWTPDKITYVGAIEACASSQDLEQAVQTDVVVCNTLLSMYAKCGASAHARAVFESMSRRNVITWNGIMKAYALQGEFGEALALFQRLEAEKEVKPDRVTFVVAIDCCACKPCLEEGRRIHASVVASGLDLDLIIGNTLVNMYGKCGQVGTARGLFDKMVVRDVVTWSSLLATYASNGHGMEGLELFRLMQQDYTEPNEVTFLGVLFACSHLGFVRESKSYLFAMQRDYGLTPGQEHFSCVIDLLARSGRLDEAEELVRGLPFQPDNVIVTSLLGACTTQGDLKRGIRAAELVFGLDASDQVPYVLLWNIFAAAGHWDGVERVEKALGWRALEFT
ncbi:hypothetical protein SELMODRAFT_132472 [Selaginella moellendorffii]|uniref:Pentacotripeptide-repeat region of PRORP domain-containing protein n=1 Tax=Selaginella moellendorffii TaxID=88036 RepID=D8T5H5_SELML|nr:hypothetical protein SELMODRAFT_132472 [Selaginella moellendorffii]